MARNPGAPPELHLDNHDGVIGVSITRGDATDHLLLNTTGQPQTRDDLTSDARLTLVRSREADPGTAAVVWGSHVAFRGRELTHRAHPGD